jgi:hypothetical protein
LLSVWQKEWLWRPGRVQRRSDNQEVASSCLERPGDYQASEENVEGLGGIMSYY